MDYINVIDVGTVRKSATVNEDASVQRTHLLGRAGKIDDVDRSQRSNGRAYLSGMDVWVRYVQSTASGNLTPGTAVLWDAAAVGTKVSGVAGAAADAAGIVDPFITVDVEPGDCFYVFFYGPCKVTSSAAIAAGAQIECAASGKMVTLVDGNGKGRMLEAATDADQLKRAFVDFRDLSGYTPAA